MTVKRPRVVIIGAGFGGLFTARELVDKPVDVLLIDRNNFHTFTPLLYQVATAALDPSQIAHPVRSIFRDTANVNFLLGEVTAIDDNAHTVTILAGDREQIEFYDYLVVAAGSVPNYFGNDEFRAAAFELRTLRDSVRLRNHILNLFEEAVWTKDEPTRQALLTIVVVGGGPTGVETAGAVYELYNHVLNREFAQERLQTRVILVERSPYLLEPYPPKLREAALRQVQSLGVEVILGHALAEATATYVRLDDGTVIPTHTLVWGAGVKAAPLATLLNVPLPRSGRIPVEPTTQVVNKPHLYAIGDIAHLTDNAGRPYPMLIPVAQQQGKLAAQNILAAIGGQPQQAFVYHDRGTMATIGRSRAVAWLFNRIQLTGLAAWFAWLGLHLVMLLGFSKRVNVFIHWAWNYLTYDRSVRIIWVQEKSEPSPRERFPDLFAPIRDEPS
ncbi:MAG: NAD(P)/FAD-dependent oxidoreductase [Caldilineaceae bacterium]|nr:NAD(P)/FAD-dependent oxidoreductase [Caldilineaceae bacterium]